MKKKLLILVVLGAGLAGWWFSLFAGGKRVADLRNNLRAHVSAFLADVRPGKHTSAAAPNPLGHSSDTTTAAVPPASVAGIKIGGIIISARPTALLDLNGREYTVMVGDKLDLPLPEGREMVRCEKIEGHSVWLFFPRNSARVELQMAQLATPVH